LALPGSWTPEGAEEFPIGREDPDPMIPPVRHVERVAFAERDALRAKELSGRTSPDAELVERRLDGGEVSLGISRLDRDGPVGAQK